jgi:hypothetical protein
VTLFVGLMGIFIGATLMWLAVLGSNPCGGVLFP